MKFLCNDGSGEVGVEAATAEEAAQEYIDGGQYGMDERTKTGWVNVHVWTEDTDVETIRITLDPVEPPCEGKPNDDDPATMWVRIPARRGAFMRTSGHDWREVSVRGEGGGVIVVERCRHCGREQITNTWAENPRTGEQGLHSVEYPELESYASGAA